MNLNSQLLVCQYKHKPQINNPQTEIYKFEFFLTTVANNSYHFWALDIDGNVYTDKDILDKSYWLVKHCPDFPLWEYRISSFLELNCYN